MGRHGNGGYRIDPKSGMIHVFGVVNRKRRSKSTGKKPNDPCDERGYKNYEEWIKIHYREKLTELLGLKKPDSPELSLVKFGKDALNATKHKRKVAEHNNYIQILDNHIIPYFKYFDLKDFTPSDIEGWQQSLLNGLGSHPTQKTREPLSSSYVYKCRRVLGLIFKQAEKRWLIDRNPCNFAEHVKVVSEKKEIYTIEEMKKIISNADGWFKVFISVAYATGMRVGEIIGLMWKDIDFENNVLYLSRSISKGDVTDKDGVIKLTEYMNNGYTTIINKKRKVAPTNETKNHHRIVILPDFLITLLKELKEKNPTDWVFITQNKKPFADSKNVRIRHFEPLLERIEVKYKTLQALRNTFVSVMRNDGVDVDFVCELAGHSKEVSDKHYYSQMVTPAKLDAVNNVFSTFQQELSIGL